MYPNELLMSIIRLRSSMADALYMSVLHACAVESGSMVTVMAPSECDPSWNAASETLPFLSFPDAAVEDFS